MVAATSPGTDLFWYDEYDTARPLRSFGQTAVRGLFRPRRFFARLDPEGSFLTALAFASGYVGVYAALSTISSALVEVELHGATLALPNVVGATLANIAASILAVWVVLPVAAVVYHVFVRLLIGPTNHGYRATFRVLAYAGAGELVGWVPFIGLLLAAVWAVYLATVGLRELHATTAGRALAALAVPTLVLGALTAAGAAWVMLGPPALDQLFGR